MAIMYITIGAVRVVRCRVDTVCLSTIDIIILIIDIDAVEPARLQSVLH